GPAASGAWMEEFGSHYFDLARKWDGTFGHQGPPQAQPDSYDNWDATGAYLLAYAAPYKNLYILGRGGRVPPQLSKEKAMEIVRMGRGWSPDDRESAYDRFSDQQLLQLLGSWSPTVRHRAAYALERRRAKVAPQLIQLLQRGTIEQRRGAALAIGRLGNHHAGSAFNTLLQALDHRDLWLRVKAAEALARMGDRRQRAFPYLMAIIIRGPSRNDPRGMEQRFISQTLFGNILRNSIEGVDIDQLRVAMMKALQNEDGRARSSVGRVYKHLTFEQIKPLLPAIVEAIVEPAPSGIMFAAGIRLDGVEALADHRIAEGMPLALHALDVDTWGMGNRIPRVVEILRKYGPAAREILPQLRRLEQHLTNHQRASALSEGAQLVRDLVREIEASNPDNAPQLRRLNLPDLVKNLKVIDEK
ncbi:MAG: DUF6288 domain-containing protein, partial [Phycisphaeraceae bacterium]|nr:DUF6288 domain-containing protein [Phycisphaeraceae bacterium]